MLATAAAAENRNDAFDTATLSLRDESKRRMNPAALTVQPPASAPMAGRDENLFSWDYVTLVGKDIKETFTAPSRWSTDDWVIAAGVVAGIGITYAFDRDIQKAVQRNHNGRVEGVFDAVEPFGAEYSFGVLGGFYLGGELLHDQRAKAVGMDGLAASLIASGLIAQPLKYGFGRSRPNQHRGSHHFDPFSGDESFPSGHATQAFAVASVVAEHYDSMLITGTSYTLASMVGFARMNNDAHWASDVLAGAAIGTLVGDLVVKINENHRGFVMTPLIDEHMAGIEVSIPF